MAHAEGPFEVPYTLPYDVFDELKDLANEVRVVEPPIECWEFAHFIESSKSLKEIVDIWFTREFEQFYYNQFGLGEIETKFSLSSLEGDTHYYVKKIVPAGKFLDMFQKFFLSLPTSLSWHSYQEKKGVDEEKGEAYLYFTNKFADGWDEKVPVMKGYHVIKQQEEGKYIIHTKMFIHIVRTSGSVVYYIMSPLISAAEKLLSCSIRSELEQLFSTLAVVEFESK